MAENNWSIQDGRSILVEFETPAVATNWGWFGMRGSGEGMEYQTPAIAWTEHAWLRGGQMIMAGGTPPVGGAVSALRHAIIAGWF